jgi:NAD-specific glutamate dehydrogenase
LALYFATVNKLKKTFFLQQGQKKTQKKLLSFKSNENKTEKVNTTVLPPVKCFLYSHIARLRTFFLQDGKVP